MEKFIGFIAEILDVDPHELNSESGYGSISEWDSLMHLRIIAEVEQKFGVNIPIDEVFNVNTIEKLYINILKDSTT